MHGPSALRPSLGALSFGGLLDRVFDIAGGDEFSESRALGSVDHANSASVPGHRRDEGQRGRIRMPHVVGSSRVVTAHEQCPGAVKERLPACYDEFVADVSEEAPCPAGWFDDQDAVCRC
jgi:hypothetical protein